MERQTVPRHVFSSRKDILPEDEQEKLLAHVKCTKCGRELWAGTIDNAGIHPKCRDCPWCRSINSLHVLDKHVMHIKGTDDPDMVQVWID
jgi:phage FluMu protein Com